MKEWPKITNVCQIFHSLKILKIHGKTMCNFFVGYHSNSPTFYLKLTIFQIRISKINHCDISALNFFMLVVFKALLLQYIRRQRLRHHYCEGQLPISCNNYLHSACCSCLEKDCWYFVSKFGEKIFLVIKKNSRLKA